MADNIISVRNLSFSYAEEDNPQKNNVVLKILVLI